jgi:hypothetical protein
MALVDLLLLFSEELEVVFILKQLMSGLIWLVKFVQVLKKTRQITLVQLLIMLETTLVISLEWALTCLAR